MATVRTESLVDDLDGAADARTVTFAVDNFAYEIDLTEQHRSDLYDALETYMASGRQVHGERAKPKPARNGRQPARTDPAQLAAIRAWALANNQPVKPRGRIAGSIVAAYEAAHQEATA